METKPPELSTPRQAWTKPEMNRLPLYAAEIGSRGFAPDDTEAS